MKEMRSSIKKIEKTLAPLEIPGGVHTHIEAIVGVSSRSDFKDGDELKKLVRLLEEVRKNILKEKKKVEK